MRKILITSVGMACVLAGSALAQGVTTGQTTTTHQTTTTTAKDGNTTTTTTTTKTESTNWGLGLGNGMFGPPKHGGFSYESLGGSWKIGEERGDKICDLTLEPKKFISSYGARTSIGCPEGLFGVSSWMLAGDEVRLLSPAGSVLAKLHPAGHNRWNGRTTAGLEIFMTKQ